jgi:hypothetical protein
VSVELHTISDEPRISGQMAAVSPSVAQAPHFYYLIGAIVCATAFLFLSLGLILAPLVNRDQLEAAVARIEDRRREDDKRRDERERQFVRDLDDQRQRLALAEERSADRQRENLANVVHIRGDLQAIAKRIGVLLSQSH